MTNQITREYRKARSEGWRAQDALRRARTLIAWAAEECDAHDEPGEPGYNVRLHVKVDDSVSLEDLKGDCFNFEVCGFPYGRSQLAAQERAFEDRVNDEGVFGIVGEYWNGEEWVEVDAVWGFVGDDWRGSGYDDDIMRATLDALQEHRACPVCPTCGQRLSVGA